MGMSMTGYGRAEQVVEGRNITVEIKSVNHRFLELSVRVPRAYGYLENKVQSLMKGTVSRGKVEVTVNVITQGGQGVQLNAELAACYLAALRELGQAEGLEDDLTLSSIIRLPDLFGVQRPQEDEEEIWAVTEAVTKEALEGFLAMRRLEGEGLLTDLREQLDIISRQTAMVEERSPKTVLAYRERLIAKLQEVLADRSLDEGRILTEAAIFADRVAVAEETVRMRSHLDQFHAILALHEPIGRKLDFLVQEMNREANTMGSKAQDLEIVRGVVEMKSAIEKIREQIQNLE